MQVTGPVGSTVEILRDRAGIPHVFAASTADLYFGLGFAVAQDRLWQMDRLRRRALGRQAEILGEDHVKSDLTHLTVGIDLLAEADAARLSGPTREIAEAYVAGVNHYIAEHRDDLPPEFKLLDYSPEPFTVRDVIAILRGIWWSLNGRLEQIVAVEAARLLPDDSLRAAYLTPEAPEQRIIETSVILSAAKNPRPLAELHQSLLGSGDATGSNNWAVAASRSASGHAMLCSDPHQPFWLPSSWHEYVLHGPEDEVAGAGHPGVPGIWFGSNRKIAWGITNNAASTRDLYREEVNHEDPTLYRDGEIWRHFDERTVTIPVRGEASRTFTIRSTVRGPIVNDLLPSVDDCGDPPLSLRWVGHEPLDDLTSLLSIGNAYDWPSFRDALSGWSVPIFNFGYADHTGAVGYQCAGRVPIRARITRGYRDASNDEDRWQGYVPFDSLPRIENPPRGYVATANNRATPDDFPYPLHGAWAAGHRAVRLEQFLDTPKSLTHQDMIALQTDVTSCRAERLVPRLVEHLSHSHDPDISFLRDTLAAWDFRYTHESAAPLLFESFTQAWQSRVAAERFPSRLAPLVTAHGSAAFQLIERGPDSLHWFAGGETAFTTALHDCALHAVSRLRAELGEDRSRWTWGAAHLAYWLHPLNHVNGLNPTHTAEFHVGPAPVDGGADTVCNTGAGSRFESNGGAEYRLVVDFANADRIWAVQNAGNSGVPGDPHYADQFSDWTAGNYHVVHLDRANLELNLESRTVLSPLPEGEG